MGEKAILPEECIAVIIYQFSANNFEAVAIASILLLHFMSANIDLKG